MRCDAPAAQSPSSHRKPQATWWRPRDAATFPLLRSPLRIVRVTCARCAAGTPASAKDCSGAAASFRAWPQLGTPTASCTSISYPRAFTRRSTGSHAPASARSSCPPRPWLGSCLVAGPCRIGATGWHPESTCLSVRSCVWVTSDGSASPRACPRWRTPCVCSTTNTRDVSGSPSPVSRVSPPRTMRPRSTKR